ncbi:MAG: PAS domain-containing sensor histidine kinase [Rickettsiales bacterium]|nr:PAS domain-containing sensor histidine kinase [Rickettsiales bacterium]
MKNIFRKIFSLKSLVAIIVLLLISASALMYNLFSESFQSYQYDIQLTQLIIVVNASIAIILIILIGKKIQQIRRRAIENGTGSRMQKKVVVLFTLLTIIPSLITASFAVSFFLFGMRGWFDEKISETLNNSVKVAEAYLKEHSENIKADSYSMSRDITRFANELVENKKDFQTYLTAQANWRNLSDVIVFRKEDILAHSDGTIPYLIDFDAINSESIARADNGEIVLTTEDDDKVKVLIKLKGFNDTYLLVSRKIDPKVLEYTKQTKDSAFEYNSVRQNADNLQLQFILAFIGVSTILVLSAIWIGLIFAYKLVSPIHKLIKATERVQSGDLTVRLEDRANNDEVTTLFKAFNRMTGNLQKNQLQLVEVNRQIDQRRRLIEAVFSGVNSGIIALDEHKRIRIFNKSVADILKVDEHSVSGRYIADIFPEITLYFSKLREFEEKIFQQQIDIKRDGVIQNLLIRIVTEENSRQVEGYIITIDNISKLVNAQRMAAWSDVARRIAHEIKNPLTPINLSAERIRNKFGKLIAEEDKENFNRYIDTIIRHSENIERIVKEFSDFARMPEPIMLKNNICEVIKEAVFSEKVVNSEIEYNLNIPDREITFDFDKEQISRVLLNTLKNAGESLKENGVSKEGEAPRISISLVANKNAEIEITDNGKGFNPELLNRITEPYVTTREKGTGLGLAIVKKIIDDHSGSIELSNMLDENGVILGAKVRIVMPI